ncbi:MAG: adenylate kinase [Paludibacteraceae bacterium]|jgi:adenylate kinase|nr:adenylate kinase [Paludibacteraceae bacterium]
MKYVVLFGPPGSGKGTQSENIIKKYGYGHISTGDVLRAEMANNTELGKTAKDYIEAGKLVPDSLIIDMLAKTMDSFADAKGVIFDGFPRTVAQAVALKDMLAQRGADVSVMLNLIVEEQELINRLIERGKTSGRSDDNLETIKKRLDTYNEQTSPVIDFYKEDGKLANIQGMGSIEDIFASICVELDK